MTDFSKELDDILENDPLGVLTIKPKKSAVASADERLLASFEQINDFVRENGHEPTKSTNIKERQLYSRLEGLRGNVAKVTALKEYDEFGLLPDLEPEAPVRIENIDDILDDDAFGVLGSELAEDDPNDIFTLRHVSKPVPKPDYVAKRKPCKDFEQFEGLFKNTQAELASKKRVLIVFTSERQIKKNAMFVLQGMLVYVANVGKKEQKRFGNVDARLYCVFENGTESNMLLRSLASALWKDANSRQVVPASQMEMFDDGVSADDEETGFVYILRSLSDDPEISSIENLYKIGFASQSVEQRIQNAAQEPTYLMADVKIVTVFETYNLNPQKLESLIHTFFAGSCLNVDVFDSDGKRHTPREWFIVPLDVIETAVKMLISGDILNYRYDASRQEIVEK